MHFIILATKRVNVLSQFSLFLICEVTRLVRRDFMKSGFSIISTAKSFKTKARIVHDTKNIRNNLFPRR